MLIGRDDEIRRITALIDDALQLPGPLRFIQIDGEIGVGKSALLSAVLGRVRERSPESSDAQRARTHTPAATESTRALRPRRVFLVQGDRFHAEAPLTAFRVFCESLLGESLECLLDAATPSVLASRCVDALGDAALILAVDDAQWLDTASMTFLETLMRHPVTGPFVVLVVHRFEHTPWNLVRTARHRGAVLEHLTVEALSDASIARIAEGLPDDHVAAVVESSEGNPLFAHTAITGFRRHPDAKQVDEALQLAEHTGTPMLASAIAADLDTLTVPARRTLETLAVLGDSDTQSVTEVTGLDRDVVQAGAQELAERGLVSDSPHEVLHPVVRFSVYQNTDTTRRTEFHRRAAHLPDTELFTRAEHLAGALRASEALADAANPLTESEVQVLVEASDLALGSDPGAIRRWLGALPPSLRTAQSEILLARAMILTGDVVKAIERLRALIVGEGMLDVPREVSPEAQILLVNALRMTERPDEARALLATEHEWASGTDAALLREYIDVVALIDGNAPDELVSRLESLPDDSGSGLNRIVAAIYRTMTLLSEGRVPQARVTFQRVIEWIERVSNDELVTVPHATCAAVWAAYILDEYGAGATLAGRALELARRHGQADVLANLGTGLSFCQASLGLLDDADETGAEAIRAAEKYGPVALISMACAGLMVAAQGRNDLELLQQRLDDLMDVPLPEFGWFRRAVLTTRTRVSAMLGQPESCPELLGKPKDAMAALRHADAAVVAAMQGDIDTAKMLLAEGLSIADEQDQGGQRGMLLATEADLLLSTGNPLEASTVYRAARDIFEERDMRLQLGRAQAGIARADAALAEQSEPLAQLTDREREVVAAVSEGLSNRRIAERFVLSHRTVENHVRNIFKKLGIDSREELVAIAARNR